jgi:hypothetical protein
MMLLIRQSSQFVRDSIIKKDNHYYTIVLRELLNASGPDAAAASDGQSIHGELAASLQPLAQPLLEALASCRQ